MLSAESITGGTELENSVQHGRDRQRRQHSGDDNRRGASWAVWRGVLQWTSAIHNPPLLPGLPAIGRNLPVLRQRTSFR